MAAAAAIKFRDNEPQRITFKYGNVSRCQSRDNDGYYYRYDCEEGRINANEHLCAAIANNWPGRDGVLEVTKLNATRWDIKVVDEADMIYALEMKEWSDDTNSFESIDFEIIGKDITPKATQEPSKPQSKPEDNGVTEEPKAPQSGSKKPPLHTPSELSYMMRRCLQDSEEICPEGYTSAERQDVAVSLFIQYIKSNIHGVDIVAEGMIEDVEDGTPVTAVEEGEAVVDLSTKKDADIVESIYDLPF